MVSQITDNIFIGNYLNGLKTYYDYDAILNIASEIYYNDESNMKIPYLHINILDGFAFPKNIIDQCMDFLEEHDKLNHKILVHCVGGISRSPGIVICYLCLKNKWSLNTSYNVVLDKRDIIDPADAIITSIAEYLKDRNVL